MPKYFFDFFDGRTWSPDNDGLDLASTEEAWLEAYDGARSMWSDLVSARQDPNACAFEVRGEDGGHVFRFGFCELLDGCRDGAICLPGAALAQDTTAHPAAQKRSCVGAPRGAMAQADYTLGEVGENSQEQRGNAPYAPSQAWPSGAGEMALAAAEMGTWDYDLIADICRFDARAKEMYALPADTIDHRPEGIASVVHPDDTGPMFDAIQKASDPDGDGHYEIGYRIAQRDGSYRWFRAWGQALFEGEGAARRAIRIVGATRDVTFEKEAEAALRESEARHRLLIGSWAQAVWETDAGGVVVADSPSWRAYTGQSLEEWLGYGWMDAIHPDDRAYAGRQWREAMAARSLVDAEFRLRARDGGWRWTNIRAAPVLDADGQIEKWAGMNIDIHARKRAEEALRESEQRHRLLFSSMDEAYAVVEVLRDAAGKWADFRFLDANPAFIEHTSMPYPVGKTATELLGSPNPRWAELYGQALDTGKPLRLEESEGTLGRTFDLNILSLDRDRNRVAVLFTNITERKRAEQALRESETRAHLLLAELQHRVRNILSVVRSVFARTVEAGGTIDEVADHFRGRLDALARTQVVVTQNPCGTADLENLIRDELLAVSAGDDPRLELSGPEVELTGEAAEALGLVVHELTTNSIKYGALRFSDGRLAIRWSVNVNYSDAPSLVFSWEEQGVPAMSVDPRSEGFGTELITRALPYRLGAKTSFELRPGGVSCLIELPLQGTAQTRGGH